MNGKNTERSRQGPLYRTIGGCDIEISNPFGLVILGGYGDLSKKKLVPSIYRLYRNRLLPDDFFIFGTDRVEMDNSQYRNSIRAAVMAAFPEDFDSIAWSEFSNNLYYSFFDYNVPESYIKCLKEEILPLEEKHHTEGNRIFYLAIPPSIFETVIMNLGATGLTIEDKGFTNIVIEKPFGRDLDSARRLNGVLKKYFEERQIFRIDHYIAKETVQNMLMFRFANSIFEPLWNRSYVDHVQITVSETLGVEHRADYYEEAGVIRDMFQSHMFQLLAVTAMEPPVAFEADRVREEKIKILRSIRPFPLEQVDKYVVTGQYGKGKINGESVVAYREEPGVSPESIIPTFAAMKLLIDNWRWRGVPFYLRSGKNLSARRTEISIHFKEVPHMMLAKFIEGPVEPNVLVFRVQPDEGISLSFHTKKPGSLICLKPVFMDFSYQKGVELDAYEWVLLDCMIGDQMLFLREDGVELTWSLLTPLIERLETTTPIGKFPNYIAGSSGPEEASLLIEKDGRSWRPL
ncbi:MAG: glucose-6-phosphate dehydrogenase [Nitrospirota bacterium]